MCLLIFSGLLPLDRISNRSAYETKLKRGKAIFFSFKKELSAF